MPNMAKLICSTKLVMYNISEATSPLFSLHASSFKRKYQFTLPVTLYVFSTAGYH